MAMHVDDPLTTGDKHNIHGLYEALGQWLIVKIGEAFSPTIPTRCLRSLYEHLMTFTRLERIPTNLFDMMVILALALKQTSDHSIIKKMKSTAMREKRKGARHV